MSVEKRLGGLMRPETLEKVLGKLAGGRTVIVQKARPSFAILVGTPTRRRH
jgi:hypothetical protein